MMIVLKRDGAVCFFYQVGIMSWDIFLVNLGEEVFNLLFFANYKFLRCYDVF